MNQLPASSRRQAAPGPLTMVQWLVCIIAAIGFAFDTYVLLMNPLILRPALAELLHVDPLSKDPAAARVANDLILRWTGYVMWGSALCGGMFGMLGGYLTDRLGRRRVLTWSILLYAVSSAAAAFATSAEMLLFWRCMTFIGVCVEFVAAVAWLSELFPEPRRREAVLGYTQAFASTGGLLVSLVYKASYTIAVPGVLPAWLTLGNHAAGWRYALISGLIPAIPLIIIRPFLARVARVAREETSRQAATAENSRDISADVSPHDDRHRDLVCLRFRRGFRRDSIDSADGARTDCRMQVASRRQRNWRPRKKAPSEFEELTKQIAYLKTNPQQIIGNVQMHSGNRRVDRANRAGLAGRANREPAKIAAAVRVAGLADNSVGAMRLPRARSFGRDRAWKCLRSACS